MVLVTLQRELLRNIAEKFGHMYKESQGKLDYVSIQGSPFEEDVESILHFARFNRDAEPNITAKIPATKEGLKSISILTAEEIPINATECMAVRQVIAACETYVNATKNLNNPAPMFFNL